MEHLVGGTITVLMPKKINAVDLLNAPFTDQVVANRLVAKPADVRMTQILKCNPKIRLFCDGCIELWEGRVTGACA